MPSKPDTFKRLAWTRSRWVNDVEAALGEAAILFFEAKLAENNSRKRWARKWFMESDRELVRRFINIEGHPVRRKFDRHAAFEEALAEMNKGATERLREHVEREFGKRVRVRHGLDDQDVIEFWERAREMAGVVLFGAGRAFCPPTGGRER